MAFILIKILKVQKIDAEYSLLVHLIRDLREFGSNDPFR
jgi:hypothetical protein